jgi:hypothetical protein
MIELRNVDERETKGKRQRSKIKILSLTRDQEITLAAGRRIYVRADYDVKTPSGTSGEPVESASVEVSDNYTGMITTFSPDENTYDHIVFPASDQEVKFKVKLVEWPEPPCRGVTSSSGNTATGALALFHEVCIAPGIGHPGRPYVSAIRELTLIFEYAD